MGNIYPVVPNPVSERITVIDALRGIALIGICLTHAMQYFGGYPSSPVVEPSWLETINVRTGRVVSYLLVAKFYIIFSFLFGLSFFIQMDRASARGVDFRPRFLWRLTLLLVIGLLHNMIFSLDILMIYAILGFPLVFMYRLPTKALAVLAGFLLLGGVQLGVVGCKALCNTGPKTQQVQEEPRRRTAPPTLTFGEIVHQNVTTRLERKIDYQIQSGRGFMTLGLFILGLIAGRIGLFHNLDRYRKTLYRGVAPAVVLLLSLYLVLPHVPPGNGDTFRGWLIMPTTNAISLLTAYLWVVFILWIYRFAKVQRVLVPLVSYGRMGLTNYVVQSLVGVFAFYGFGLGLNQYLGTFTALLFCLGYTLLQIGGSHLWLKTFRFGPLEWLWRSGTYLQWQPLRRN